ncbi:T9SS type A sorting domain-containing protein [Hymenobacter sp. BT559]|uniref:T9SS type A sorting domain-containing protein n=1 Tax=Hymenobacter sp. BT559 TaxID=2795729 RepID=UPI0018ED8FB5|nr:T9SS type A sorting domain-containing protein [Hymenobacter sp. BT559]MBJ6143912.1 T9SS type A sorting domain-containing protein [Hymenobacter sp. BT559]
MLLLLLLLPLVRQGQAATAYYSDGQNITVPAGGPNVSLALASEAAQQQLTATVTVSTTSPVTVRLPLVGTGQAGFRAGVLVSTTNSPSLLGLSQALQLQALGTITLRTYLGAAFQQEQVVDASLVQLALLAPAGQPTQLEFVSQAPFDRVEITFGQAVQLGVATKIHYAYAIGPETPKQVKGFLSQFTQASTDRYSTANPDGGGLCVGSGINNPERAVDADLTNYASFSSLASVGTGCGGTLRVQLPGTVPATGYRAGFVIGNAGLLDLGVLNALRLRTYRNGVLQETATATNPLQLTLLANDKALISFPATASFDEVSIERTAVLDLLNNLNIYYGFGLENVGFTANTVATSYPLSQNNYTIKNNGICTLCSSGVTAPSTGSPYLSFNQGIGALSSTQVLFPLTTTGVVGNRAGVVLGQNTVLDASVLANIVLATHDAAGNVLETATSNSLLTANLLPGGKQEVSFRTTRNFAQVSITLKATASLLNNARVYSAFADDRGTLQAISPAGPLPVVLTSFGASRPAGTAAVEIVWATASEQRSAYFVVERATNPQAGFQAVGQVAAAGASAATRQYRLLDATAPAGTVLYYRLRQVDLGGSEQLSPVATLAASGSAEGFALYPNPAGDSPVSVRLPASVAAGGTVIIYSSLGQVLRQQFVSSEAQSATLLTAGLPMGIYQVVLRNAVGQQLAAKRLVLNR